jgi:basic membrane protein A
MSRVMFDRRTLLKAGAASVVASGSMAGLARAAGVTIGIVYVGPRDDFGWNQAHAVAAKELKSIPGVNVVEEENVPETDACAKAMESMVNLDNANIILGTSFGYFDPFMIDLSKKYAKVQFRHAAPLWTPKLPMNLGSYFGYLNQAHYVDGVAAGLSTKSGTSSASSPPSRSRRCSAISIRSCWARRDQSERESPGHLHRRLVAAGA